jgi:hypothetical protein
MAKRSLAKQPVDSDVIDCLFHANAILQKFIDAIPDEQADDRYVLWTVRDMIDEVASAIDEGREPVIRRNPLSQDLAPRAELQP